MGNKNTNSRHRVQPNESTSRDARRIARLTRRLGLPDSRQDFVAWDAQARSLLPDDDVDTFYATRGESRSDVYDLLYRSPLHARVLSAGWRSHMLEVECQWIASVLRPALDTARQQGSRPILIEVGSGSGAGAAVLGALLDVHVIAVDTHPMSRARTMEMATRTGASVEAHQAGAADLIAVLDGRRPAAAFTMSTLRYIQPHHHNLGQYSWLAQMQHQLATSEPTEEFGVLLSALDGADLATSESACADYVAELDGAGTAFGYHVVADDIERITGMVGGDPVRYLGIHLAEGQPAPTPDDLLRAVAGAIPQPSPGLTLEGPQAEVLRRSMGEGQLIRATEIEYHDGSGVMRRELSTHDDLIVEYLSATTSYREILVNSIEHRREVLASIDQSESDARKVATVRTLNDSAMRW